MQDRQHGSVAGGIEKLVAVPGRGERTRFGFAVAHDARNDQVRIIECSTRGMSERVAELSAFIDRAGRLGCCMAWDSAGEGELPQQAGRSLPILPDGWRTLDL